MCRSNLIGVFFLCIAINGFGQDSTAKDYTLKKCVETAIANNLEVRQGGLQVEANQATWRQSQLEMLPNLNGSVSQGINQGRSIDPSTNGYINKRIDVASYGLSSEFVLFNGLSLRNTVKKNSLDHEASKMNWQQLKDNVTINVILAYLDVMTSEELLIQGQKQLELTTQQVQRLEVLNSNGSIRPSELYDLRGQLANDQLSMIENRKSLETSRLNLCELMNIPYDKGMKLERFDIESVAAIYPDMPTDIYNKALTEFARIRYAELRTQSAQKSVKVSQGRLFPTLSLNGGAGSNYSSAALQSVFLNNSVEQTNDYVVVNGNPSPVLHPQSNYRYDKIGYSDQLNNNITTYVSLNLRIPIFNALRARTQVKQAKINAKDFYLQEQTIKTVLQQSVERSYLNMATMYDRYKTLLEQVNSYRESFRAAEIRFNEGVGNSIDYLTARNNFDKASNNLIIAKYDYIIRTKILDYYQGKLTW